MVFHLSVTRPGLSIDAWLSDSAQGAHVRAIAEAFPDDAQLYRHDPDEAPGELVPISELPDAPA